jgi:tripartite-type tricarboxylate transporter receptor subunit TctC
VGQSHDASPQNFLHLAASAALCPFVFGLARAEDYPTRPITVIVPFAAAGPLDTLTRIVTDRMRQFLGQPVVVENVTGAAGIIGVGRVAHAAPDGYTLIAGIWSTHVVNGAVYKLSYDVLNDFAAVALLTDNAQVIVARKSMRASDLSELIAWLKANADKALAGTAGVGSPQHIFGIFFQKATDTRFGFVHYRGAAPAMEDLVAERIDLMIADQVTSLPQIGLPTFHTSVWDAIWAPKSTPVPIIVKLNAAIVQTLSDAALRQRLEELGQAVVPREQQTPEALAALHKAEIEKWWPTIKAIGIRAE